MRLIGLIGGTSWESTAHYYRIINERVRDRLGPLRSAEIILRSVDFGTIELLQLHSRWNEAADILGQHAQLLEKAGAECLVLCTNTMHMVAFRSAGASRSTSRHLRRVACGKDRRLVSNILQERDCCTR